MHALSGYLGCAALSTRFSPEDGRSAAARKSRCLLYTSDAADERSSVDLGGRRIIKNKNKSYLSNNGNIEQKNPNKHHSHNNKNEV